MCFQLASCAIPNKRTGELINSHLPSLHSNPGQVSVSLGAHAVGCLFQALAVVEATAHRHERRRHLAVLAQSSKLVP